MENNIAFVGNESFDIVLYISRILSKLNKKVLIADYSKADILKCSIAIPEGIEDKIITYRQVDYTSEEVTDDIYNKYNVILNYYANQKPQNEIKKCNHIVYVTNLYKHNLNNLEQLESYNIDHKFLLIRDLVNIKITPLEVAEYINKGIDKSNIFVLYQNEIDSANAILCQHNQCTSFITISRKMKSYLIKQIKAFYPNIDYNEIKDAFRKARKGV